MEGNAKESKSDLKKPGHRGPSWKEAVLRWRTMAAISRNLCLFRRLAHHSSLSTRQVGRDKMSGELESRVCFKYGPLYMWLTPREVLLETSGTHRSKVK